MSGLAQTRGHRRTLGSAAHLAPVVHALLGPELPIAIRFWDGTRLGPELSSSTIVVRSPRALRRLLYAPGELGLGRAYVAGELDVEGDIFDVVALGDLLEERQDGDPALRLDRRATAGAWRAARDLGVLGPPLAPPAEEARLRGLRHSPLRDSAAVRHHYDVSNDFYRLVLGPSMTYSCAYFPAPGTSLEEAQAAKYELVCRKLGLEAGMRLLDVGCGWGGMVRHAVAHHGVEAVGITASRAQQDWAYKAVADAGLADRIDIRLQDYREVADGPYHAVSSIGMFEHVGLARAPVYFRTLFGLLAPRGRLLNHAISRPPGQGSGSDSFINRYVFPDSELLEVGTTVSAMQGQGFEVRDVESLREHYATTLRRWVANLEAHWDEAVALVGPARARIWRLYMAGCCRNFEHGQLGLHQVLGVKPGPNGASGMPPTRARFAPGLGQLSLIPPSYPAPHPR